MPDKEYKQLSTFEKIMQWFIPIAAIVIAVIATLFLFVFKQPCGTIDKEYVWCEVHPMSGWDVIGLILYYIGTLWLSSILPKILINVFGVDDDEGFGSIFNWIAFIFCLCFLLIYV